MRRARIRRRVHPRRAKRRAAPLRVPRRQSDTGAVACAPPEVDETRPWSRMDLIDMDRAFCAAMERAIARGSERPRGPAAKSAAPRAIRRMHPRRSRAARAAAGADMSERDRSWRRQE
jgi:hypothetical protein